MSGLVTFAAIVGGLAATALLGLLVPRLLALATKSMDLPSPGSALSLVWARVVGGNEGGDVLGHLERLLFFGAFVGGADVVVAGWLAFKVASKWNAWTNIVAVPKELPGVDPLEYLAARRSWASHVLVKFLVGTLANVLAGYLGAAIARYAIPCIWAAWR